MNKCKDNYGLFELIVHSFSFFGNTKNVQSKHKLNKNNNFLISIFNIKENVLKL